MKRSFFSGMITAPILSALVLSASVMSAPGAAFARNDDQQQQVEGIVQPDPIVQRLQSRVETLESANRRLTGDIEALQQQNRVLQTENQSIRSLADELTARIVQMEQAMKVQAALGFGASDLPSAPPPKPGAENTAAAPAPLAPSTQLLREGQYKLSSGDLDGASTTLQSVISQFPKTADATEARYWLGETQYVQGDYPNAAQTYVNLLQIAPKAKRAPDAMVRLGSTLGKMGSKSDGCTTLSQVLVQYPKAAPATKTRLKNEKLSLGCKA